jgi:hypothetical protein
MDSHRFPLQNPGSNQQGSSMELSDVKAIKELNGPRAERRVNDFLGIGWVLVAVSTMTTDSREYSEPGVKYVMGWTGTLPALYPEDVNR